MPTADLDQPAFRDGGPKRSTSVSTILFGAGGVGAQPRVLSLTIPLTTSVGTARAMSATADAGIRSLSMILSDEDIRTKPSRHFSLIAIFTPYDDRRIILANQAQPLLRHRALSQITWTAMKVVEAGQV